MKIRNGFVSNSSSSSFVLIVDKEAHDKAMEQLKDHKYIEILKEIMGCIGKDKFMGVMLLLLVAMILMVIELLVTILWMNLIRESGPTLKCLKR